MPHHRHARALLASVLLLVAACTHAPSHAVIDNTGAWTLHAPAVLASIDANGDIHTQAIDTPADIDASARHAFRIASVTKTYVAATVLRLVEQGRVALDAPIVTLIDPRFDAILKSDGYDTARITVKHLLSHTGGLNDHAQSPNFIAVWRENPRTYWQRAQHVEKLATWTEPVGAPGERFFYSDTGYVLLGDMIERATGQPLARAVREQLKLDALGLEATWWEQSEEPVAERAHQHLAGVDTHGWNASLDLYGGGGLVTTVPDMARFFRALLEGRVFDKPTTLETMLSADGLPESSPYRLGIFAYNVGGRTLYGHAGFWGTYVAHDPASGRTFAGAAYDTRDYKTVVAMGEAWFTQAKPTE